VLEIGDLLEAPAAARRVVDRMQARLDHVRRQIRTDAHRPRVFFQIGIAPIVSVGSDTFIHELIEAAGGVNLAGTYKGYPRFSFEEIVAAGPDMVIITSMARQHVFEQVREKWGQWPTIPAVKNDQIFLVDSNLFDRPTPRLLDGLETLARLIHPALDFDGDRE
jgi:iron complex transport system substrate-binding protein